MTNDQTKVIEVLEMCGEYMENKADADYENESYVPNKEMRLLLLIREVSEALHS